MALIGSATGRNMSLESFLTRIRLRTAGGLFGLSPQFDPLKGRRDNPSVHLVVHEDFDDSLSVIFNNLPDPDEIIRKANLDPGAAYRDTKTDAHVSGALMQRKSVNKLSELVIIEGKEADGKNSQRTDQARRLVDDQISNIGRMRNVISEVLDAPFFGATYLEMFWNVLPTDQEMRPAGEIVLFDLMAKPFEWFGYTKQNVLGIKSTLTSQDFDIIPIPLNKFIPIVNEGSYRNPYGERAAKAVFWPYQFKKGGIRFWNEFLEKYGMPFLFGRVDQSKSKDDVNQLHNDLVEMVRNGVIVVQDDGKGTDRIETIESKTRGASSDAYNTFKNAMNIEISKAILAETLTIENSESGSQAATKFHVEMLRDVQGSDRIMVQDGLNRVFRLQTDLNFGKDVPAPTAELVNPKDINTERAERDKSLKESLGVQFKKSYIAKTYKIEDEDFDLTALDGLTVIDDNGKISKIPTSAEDTNIRNNRGGKPTGKGGPQDRGTLKATNPQALEAARRGAANFQEGEDFPVQDAVDAFAEETVAKLTFLGKPLQKEIVNTLLAATDYADFIISIVKLKDQVNHGQLSEVLSTALNYFEIAGVWASQNDKV